MVLRGAGACATADEHPLVRDKGRSRGKIRKMSPFRTQHVVGHNNHARV